MDSAGSTTAGIGVGSRVGTSIESGMVKDTVHPPRARTFKRNVIAIYNSLFFKLTSIFDLHTESVLTDIHSVNETMDKDVPESKINPSREPYGIYQKNY